MILVPRGAQTTKYLGDLLYKRSYNVAFANLSPPYPRDLGLPMLLAFLVLAAFLMWRFMTTGGPEMLAMMSRPPEEGEAQPEHHH